MKTMNTIRTFLAMKTTTTVIPTRFCTQNKERTRSYSMTPRFPRLHMTTKRSSMKISSTTNTLSMNNLNTSQQQKISNSLLTTMTRQLQSQFQTTMTLKSKLWKSSTTRAKRTPLVMSM